MKVDKILDTKQKQINAVKNLNSLTGHPGWLVIRQILSADVEDLEKAIFTAVSRRDHEEAEDLERRRFYQEALLDLPEKLSVLIQSHQGQLDDLDPYDKIDIPTPKA